MRAELELKKSQLAEVTLELENYKNMESSYFAGQSNHMGSAYFAEQPNMEDMFSEQHKNVLAQSRGITDRINDLPLNTSSPILPKMAPVLEDEKNEEETGSGYLPIRPIISPPLDLGETG